MDHDGHCGDVDNCLRVPNESQADTDGDGRGDACATCEVGTDARDSDADGVKDPCDDRIDSDGDGTPNFCDMCWGDDGTGDAD